MAEFKQHGNVVAEKNCSFQKDLFIKFRIVFRFQYKAGCEEFYIILIVLLVFLSLNVNIMHK